MPLTMVFSYAGEMEAASAQLDAAFCRSKHEAALPYDRYLASDPEKATRWREFERGVHLTGDQKRLVGSFSRTIRVLVVSGIWCGDCVQQCPMLAAIASAGPEGRIDLRFLDRDEHTDLASLLSINAGLRVPVALFMAEDFEPVSIFGDRTLSRYRALAAKQLGAACPLPGASVGQDEVAATLRDWIDEFERVHLLLRVSGRLRQRHGD